MKWVRIADCVINLENVTCVQIDRTERGCLVQIYGVNMQPVLVGILCDEDAENIVNEIMRLTNTKVIEPKHPGHVVPHEG